MQVRFRRKSIPNPKFVKTLVAITLLLVTETMCSACTNGALVFGFKTTAVKATRTGPIEVVGLEKTARECSSEYFHGEPINDAK
jgi:hypothetical protein